MIFAWTAVMEEIVSVSFFAYHDPDGNGQFLSVAENKISKWETN